jgi:pilus assembly protein CpaB
MKSRLIGAALALVIALGGAVILIGYVNEADARAADGAAFVASFVVTTEIPAGTSAEEISTFVSVKQIPALAAVPGRVSDLADLTGLVADVALMPGEQLLTSRFIDPASLADRNGVPLPDGMQAVTVALPVENVVGGEVTAGDTAGVLISATIKRGDTEVRVTRETFHKVLVLKVQPGTSVTPGASATDAPAASTDPVTTLMVTLALSTADVETLVWGQQFGSLWLTLEPAQADETGSRSVDESIIFP